jgi:hypothetical protein
MRWTPAILIFLVTGTVAFVPVLLLLALTPLHDGSDVPGPLLFYSTVFASAVLGLIASRLWFKHGPVIEVRAAIKVLGCIFIAIAMAVLPLAVWVSGSWGLAALLSGLAGAAVLAIGLRETPRA